MRDKGTARTIIRQRIFEVIDLHPAGCDFKTIFDYLHKDKNWNIKLSKRSLSGRLMFLRRKGEIYLRKKKWFKTGNYKKRSLL